MRRASHSAETELAGLDDVPILRYAILKWLPTVSRASGFLDVEDGHAELLESLPV
jgi:hypothetical protein